MPKIKLTKSELKTQRDSLKQFTRFLPTLQLKKQQLQLEARKSQERVELNKKKESDFKNNITSWIAMFGLNDEVERIIKYIKIEGIFTDKMNIAGVGIPVYKGAKFAIHEYDLFIENPWVDDGIKALCDLVEIRAERDVIIEQYRRISNELRITTQRVNLFEKVKIPLCKENIKKIQIYLGDQLTSAVGRSKIAKKKLSEAVL
ncbi:MAG TPA: V-type ATP synthase subunit D [Lentisphaeria bacterium]|nr:MAG: V-type ATP synthase subunit D [Lentisphaerae bacterium GWF2_38_69]HBM15924.1 V-type ATP synthase subunit D [Lentisphaeria bacterium]